MAIEAVVAIEAVMAVEAVVAAKAVVAAAPAWVTAPEAVTAPAVAAASSRLAGRMNRKHDRQCGERYECQLLRTYQLVHGDALLSPPTPFDGTAPSEIRGRWA
jgi:hypothetical protein